jgi:phosphoserine phosphatase
VENSVDIIEILTPRNSSMWVAFVLSYRLILDFVIRPRKQYVGDKLVELVKKHPIKSLVVTGGLNFYREALLKHFGVLR